MADRGPPRLFAGLRSLSGDGGCVQPQRHGVVRDEVDPGHRAAPTRKVDSRRVAVSAANPTIPAYPTLHASKESVALRAAESYA